MSNLINFYSQKLTELKTENNFRSLFITDSKKIDFASNDYLGIANIDTSTYFTDYKINKKGSTGSRLITGNYLLIEELENFISNFHQGEGALFFSCGYMANLAVFSVIGDRHDLILYDELIHASMRDGIRLGITQNRSFKHNDLNDLEEKLKLARTNSSIKINNIIIAIESLYSMDGDFSPLQEIYELALKYDCEIVIDEAHSVGIMGEKGRGYTNSLNLEKKILARVFTYGKAFGRHGATVVANNKILIDWIINKARSFIYTTAPNEQEVLEILKIYLLFEKGFFTEQINKLNHNLNLLKTKLALSSFSSEINLPESWIYPFLLNNKKNKEIKKAQFDFINNLIKDNQIFAKIIKHPTVALGQERLRICLHSFNTETDIEKLHNVLYQYLEYII